MPLIYPENDQPYLMGMSESPLILGPPPPGAPDVEVTAILPSPVAEEAIAELILLWLSDPTSQEEKQELTFKPHTTPDEPWRRGQNRRSVSARVVRYSCI